MTRILAVALAAVALAAAAPGCQRKAELGGIGPYLLGKTRLVDGEVNFRCEPSGEVTFCFGGPVVAVGDQPAAVSLYFAGTDKMSPLVEIFLNVRSCKVDALDAVLGKLLGPPTESRDKRRFWVLKRMFVAAALRTTGASCELSFVDPRDEKRIAELRAGK